MKWALDDLEAASRIEKLAEGVMTGEVTSHTAIALRIRNLGPKLGPLGGISSTQIDWASFKLAYAIKEKLASLTGIEELIALQTPENISV